MPNIQRATAAVNFLIASPNFARLTNEMTSIIEKWDTHPMVYGPQLDMLNSLIDIGLANRDAFEAVLKLVQSKRALLPKAKRQDYQRQLMRERRTRTAKAVALHEAKYGKMPAPKRKEYIAGVHQRWGEARTEWLSQAAGQVDGKLGWTERNEAIAAFWDTIDRQLDLNLAAAKKG